MANKTLSLCLALTATLSASCGAPIMAAPARPQTAPLDLEQQILEQGPMLLGNLRQARAAGLRHDPWGMAYSLQEARRLLAAMSSAERLIPHKGRPYTHRRPVRSSRPAGALPLGQILELDRPAAGGRAHVLSRFDERVGSLRRRALNRAISRALAALNHRPPALGAALLATQTALDQVRWDKGLEPKAWAAARDRVMKVYAMALDSRPEALSALDGAQHALAGLPGGRPYARRLAALRVAPAPDLVALERLVSDLDAKVQSLRQSDELGHSH